MALRSQLPGTELFQAALLALLLRHVFFRRQGTTLAEFTIAMTYIVAQSTLINGMINLFFLPFGRLPPEILSLTVSTGFTLFSLAQFLELRSAGGVLRVLAAQALATATIIVLLLAGIVFWINWVRMP